MTPASERKKKAFAVDEDRSLKTIAVDRLFVIEPRRLIESRANPRSFRQPLIEIELRVRELEPENLAAVQRAASGLARDLGRHAEREVAIQIAEDVDVRAADVERIRMDLVAVRIVHGRLDRRGVRVVGKEHAPILIDGASGEGGVVCAASRQREEHDGSDDGVSHE